MGHVAQHVVHLRVGQPAAVRRGVEQAEEDVGAGARGLRAEGGVVAADLCGPLVDVGALQGADPLAGLVGQAAPVAVLDDDQCPVLEGELDVPLDERLERLARAAGGRDPASVPRTRSVSLMVTSISASIASLDWKCL